ncbi:hypothetical protein F5Y11DRAFT_54633 [Daldinia sp. FL1419]|nr:hypothetical protein F5Y11DRAFT_54633 [Daldinia sp. FL1419]
MGAAGLITRLKKAIKPQEPTKEYKEEDVEYPELSLEENEPISKALSQSGLHAPKSNKGLRKPSVSSGHSSGRSSTRQNTSPEPSDYLYFGEGVSAAEVSKSLSIRSRSKSSNIQADQSTSTYVTQNYSTSSTSRDNSGFLKTGMDTHTSQMGYTNLTYGGSLQYDYAGTQAPGVAGFGSAT